MRARALLARHLPLMVGGRSLRRGILGVVAGGTLPLGAALLLLRNNELTAKAAMQSVTFALGLAVALVLSGLAVQLARRRPGSPWDRSLPWSAGARVAYDALLLALACLPLLAAGAWLSPVGAVIVTAGLPFVALRAVRHLHVHADDSALLGGRILFETALVLGWVAVLPWLAWAPLVLTPWALSSAAWAETHHSPWNEEPAR